MDPTAMSEIEHHFLTELDIQRVGTYRYHAIFLPEEIQAQLSFPKRTRLRVCGEINGLPFKAAWLPTGRGGYYMIVGKELRRAGGLDVGSPVHVEFRLEDPEGVDVPEALSEALARQPELEFIWSRQTAGKRRGWCYRVASAKGEETRLRRVQEVLTQLREQGP